jgi:hypothetical protein
MTSPVSAPSWTAHLPEWIPQSLTDLHGPAEGVVRLPLDLCWSGTTEFDLGSFRQRVALCHLVIVQGLDKHYPEFLNAGHLLEAWPILRRRIAGGYTGAWEDRFPELARIATEAEADRVAVARWRATTW